MIEKKEQVFKISQVSLISCASKDFKLAISFLIKKIVCLNTNKCQINNLCTNCLKVSNNTYFDLLTYDLNSDNSLKKQDILNVIDNLSTISIISQSPKICVIKNIEHSTLQASNSFLKFLENVPVNTFLIFLTSNIDQVLPTIKSRCQILDFKNLNLKNNIELERDFLKTLDLLKYDLEFANENEFNKNINLLIKFFRNDDENKFDNNFLLIEPLLDLQVKGILFFDLLIFIVKVKLAQKVDFNYQINNQLILRLIGKWKNNDDNFLMKVLQLSLEIKNKFNNKNSLNLLLNYFFIKLYRD